MVKRPKSLLPAIDPSGRYERDPTLSALPPNPVGVQQHPYFNPGWSPAYIPYAPGGPSRPTQWDVAMGQATTVANWQELIPILLVAGVLLWLVLRESGSGKGGRNRVVKLSGSSRRGYYWKLLRKGAKRHGPFASADEAASDAESLGYSVME